MQLNIKVLKAVALMASKEKNRLYLNGVYIEFHSKHIIMAATDGYGLSVVRQTLDAPLINPPAGVIIPLDLIARIKPSKIESLACAELSVTGPRVTLDYLGDTFAAPAVDATYPDWRRHVPQSVSGEVAQFNPLFAARFVAAAHLLGGGGIAGGCGGITIAHNGCGPALVNWLPAGAGKELEGFGILMPLHCKAFKTAPPAWVRD